MANDTTGEHSELRAQLVLPSIAAGIFILSGILIQLFIVTVNVVDWLRLKSMTTADQIITALCIARIIVLVFCALNFLADLLSDESQTIFYLVTLLILVMSSYSSIWLSILLSFFFCLKISTFQNVFFLRLRIILSRKVTSYLIVVCVLLPFGYSFYFFGGVRSRNSTEHLHSQNTQTEAQIYYFWNIFPLLVYFISSVLLVISLSLHMWRMKTGGIGMNSAGTYYKTITFAIASFLSCVLYSSLILAENHLTVLFREVWNNFLIHVSAVLHSVSLIYVTTKLRNRFSHIASCKPCCFSNREASETDSRVQVDVICL